MVRRPVASEPPVPSVWCGPVASMGRRNPHRGRGPTWPPTAAKPREPCGRWIATGVMNPTDGATHSVRSRRSCFGAWVRRDGSTTTCCYRLPTDSLAKATPITRWLRGGNLPKPAGWRQTATTGSSPLFARVRTRQSPTVEKKCTRPPTPGIQAPGFRIIPLLPDELGPAPASRDQSPDRWSWFTPRILLVLGKESPSRGQTGRSVRLGNADDC